MNLLKKNYEISIWRDIWTEGVGGEGLGSYIEDKLAVIGAHDMQSPFRALEPALTSKTTGETTFTFKMHKTCIDPVTGEKLENPFVTMLGNEAKIKVHYDDKWYDLYIKDIKESSTNSTVTYTASDVHISELSKNGYSLTLNSDLMNNVGSAQELAEKILLVEEGDGERSLGLGWDVDSEELIEHKEEALVRLSRRKEDSTEWEWIFSFYSCCKEKPAYFQYFVGGNGLYDIPLSENGEIDRSILDEDGVLRQDDKIQILNDPEYYRYAGVENDEIYIPRGYLFGGFVELRGERIVYTQVSKYNPILEKYTLAYDYYLGANEFRRAWCYTTSEYLTPNVLQNYITNNTFQSTSGWSVGYMADVTVGTDGELTSKYPNMPSYRADIETLSIGEDGQDLATILLNARGEGFNINKVLKTERKSTLKVTFPSEEFAYGDLEAGIEVVSLLMNSGFTDFKSQIGNLGPGMKFVLAYKRGNYKGKTPAEERLIWNSLSKLIVEVGTKEYNPTLGHYLRSEKRGEERIKSGETYLRFENFGQHSENSQASGYYYAIAEVPEEYQYTKEEFAEKQATIFIYSQAEGADPDTRIYDFEDFLLFPYVPIIKTDKDGNEYEVPMFPSQMETEDIAPKENTTHHFFYEDENEGVTTPEEIKYFYEGDYDSRPIALKAFLAPTITNQKQRTVTVERSNHFNGIQSLCESFECWADFDIQHDPYGYVTDKTVRLKKYVGQDNPVGIRYGVNLRQIDRSVDSKQLVSKLMVISNNNENAKYQSCNIGRAAANLTGDTTIYNFDYFIKQGLINPSELNAVLYTATDITSTIYKITSDDIDPENFSGFYYKLGILNRELQQCIDQTSSIFTAMQKAESELKIATLARDAAKKSYEEQSIALTKVTGVEILVNNVSDANLEKLKNSSYYIGMVNELVEYYTTWQTNSALVPKLQLTYSTYKSSYDELAAKQEAITKKKQQLVTNFHRHYARFLQEGTWQDDKYMDDGVYYADARVVSHDSAFPKITYSFGIQDISAQEGCELLNYHVGDKTWVEDPEFFGYDENGNPTRMEVVITETTDYFDSPEKKNIVVRNYKNQFQDLFSKITATTQTVQFSEGAWEKAAGFMDSDPREQANFLQDALNDADLVLSNAVNQTVRRDVDGVTITDGILKNQKLRLTSGAIMISDTDDSGAQIWKSAITAKGINASHITSGSINTAKLTIMNGDEPAFRWDKNGLTAYYFDDIFKVNTKQGVRHDKYGIYGFDLNLRDGNGVVTDPTKVKEEWIPSSLEEVKEGAQFALTWDGLLLRAGSGSYTEGLTLLHDVDKNRYYTDYGVTLPVSHVHSTLALFGKTSPYVYNAWTGREEGTQSLPVPYWTSNANVGGKPFVKILSIDNQENGEEELAIYDDGTIIAKRLYTKDALLEGVEIRNCPSAQIRSGTLCSAFLMYDSIWSSLTNRNSRWLMYFGNDVRISGEDEEVSNVLYFPDSFSWAPGAEKPTFNNTLSEVRLLSGEGQNFPTTANFYLTHSGFIKARTLYLTNELWAEKIICNNITGPDGVKINNITIVGDPQYSFDSGTLTYRITELGNIRIHTDVPGREKFTVNLFVDSNGFVKATNKN